MEENYNYVITKSALKAFTLWRILFIWTIIPIFIILIHIWILKRDKTYFYDDKIISKSGLVSKHIKETSFVGISTVRIDQSLWGRMFRFGDLYIDIIGKWDIKISGAKHPEIAREFLSQYIVSKENITSIISE